ncbi:Large exoprotein involved in heme utilization or adhesion [Nostoc flagelliforme CCNUN1]|uniref:Large exoprotein involved in heme utilization or adhesion n=1 Tax=Nostoc flagelliforme CCNUN1 TaxID=2038116 RepID=A0A2K8T4D2_9NOSO|nr:Large exoprotein involved in heme utilization or adhesion [Nostoc flagelliforme CCNUN1]
MRSPLLLLRNQSSITTNARGSGIPGGNITIDALVHCGVSLDRVMPPKASL